MTAATIDRLIPIDAYAVALDETQYYNIDPADPNTSNGSTGCTFRPQPSHGLLRTEP